MSKKKDYMACFYQGHWLTISVGLEKGLVPDHVRIELHSRIGEIKRKRMLAKDINLDDVWKILKKEFG